MTTERQTVRSLQELCVTKLQDLILDLDTADDDFKSLEPRIQMLLFNKSRTEKARLEDVSKKVELLSRKMKPIDLQVCLGTSFKLPDPLEDTDRDLLRRKWKYKSESDKYDWRADEWLEDHGTEWTDYELRLGVTDIKPELIPHIIQSQYGERKLPKMSVD